MICRADEASDTCCRKISVTERMSILLTMTIRGIEAFHTSFAIDISYSPQIPGSITSTAMSALR